MSFSSFSRHTFRRCSYRSRVVVVVVHFLMKKVEPDRLSLSRLYLKKTTSTRTTKTSRYKLKRHPQNVSNHLALDWVLWRIGRRGSRCSAHHHRMYCTSVSRGNVTAAAPTAMTAMWPSLGDASGEGVTPNTHRAQLSPGPSRSMAITLRLHCRLTLDPSKWRDTRGILFESEVMKAPPLSTRETADAPVLLGLFPPSGATPSFQ